jgi:hypothetical protein
MQKLSQFILSSLMVGFFWVCTTAPVVSSPNAKTWGNVFRNSYVLALPINLAGYCINKPYRSKQWRKIKTRGKVRITGIGAVVDTNYVMTSHKNPRVVGIRVIPYVISKKQNKPLFLIPEIPRKIAGVQKHFNEFYPACTPKYNNLAKGEDDITYYPLVLLNVDDEKNRDVLAKYLRKLPRQNYLQKGDFLKNPIKVRSVSTVGKLFEKVFSQKQATFLADLPFDVRVKLIDETKHKPMQFVVKSTVPLITAPLPIENCDSVVPEPEFDETLWAIEILKEEKRRLVKKLERTERMLKWFEKQIAQLKTNQRKRETKIVGLEAENANLKARVKQLTEQLAAAKNVSETPPDSFLLVPEILQLDQ